MSEKDYKCIYEVWDDKEKKMKPCGEHGIYFKVTPSKRAREVKITKREVCLCKDHFNFVKDAVENIEVLKAIDEKETVHKKTKRFSVWMVTSTSDFNEKRVEGLFWSKKKAQEYIKKANHNRVYDYDKWNVI